MSLYFKRTYLDNKHNCLNSKTIQEYNRCYFCQQCWQYLLISINFESKQWSEIPYRIRHMIYISLIPASKINTIWNTVYTFKQSGVGNRVVLCNVQLQSLIVWCNKVLEKVLIENIYAKPISDASNVTYASDFSLCTYEIDNRTRLNAEKE